jgi:hypothetical protein
MNLIEVVYCDWRPPCAKTLYHIWVSVFIDRRLLVPSSTLSLPHIVAYKRIPSLSEASSSLNYVTKFSKGLDASSRLPHSSDITK